MQLKIKNQENFWAGLMFIGIGLIVILACREHPMGTSMRMGPGYFPTFLGIIMAILGTIITFISFRVEGEKVKQFAWRPMALLGLGFAIFGWAIDHIGFVAALFAMIFCSALAGKEFKLVEALITSVVLIIGTLVLFIYGLGLPFPLFW